MMGSPSVFVFLYPPGLFSTSTSGRLLVKAGCLPCSASPVPEGDGNGVHAEPGCSIQLGDAERQACPVRWRHRRGSRKQLQAKTGDDGCFTDDGWAGWRQDGRTNWKEGVVRVGRQDHRALGPAKRRCLGGLPPLLCFSRPAGDGDQTSSASQPLVLVQCPRCSPPTLQRSAKMELQGREGTDGQHDRGGPTRGGPFSTQTPLPRPAHCVCSTASGHWPVATAHRGPAAQQQEGPQPGQEGTAEASAATNQNSRASNVFCPGPTNGDIEDAPPTSPSRNLGT